MFNNKSILMNSKKDVKRMNKPTKVDACNITDNERWNFLH
jgi:hypothetical protein